MTTPFTCPDCGALLYIDPDALVSEPFMRGETRRDAVYDDLPRRLRPAPVAFCSGCEWCLEITRGASSWLKS